MENDSMKPDKPNTPAPPPRDGNANVGEYEPTLTGRRTFFATTVEIAASCIAVLFAIPFVRYLFYPLSGAGRRAASRWSPLGPAGDFKSLSAPLARWITVSQNDGWLQSQSKKPVYVTKNAQGQVEVLTAVCPHLGCTIQWNAAKEQFLCPCHGSVFAPDGAHIAGPAPRRMDSLPMSIQNGQLNVQYQDFQQLVPTKQVVG
jgi:menaquinol-cytochrome c reductase iron-sulfur subunit